METVEARLAFEWTCENCGRDHFVRARGIAPEELSQEEKTEIREHCGQFGWADGEFSMAPTRVTCKDCGAQYKTSFFNEANDGS